MQVFRKDTCCNLTQSGYDENEKRKCSAHVNRHSHSIFNMYMAGEREGESEKVGRSVDGGSKRVDFSLAVSFKFSLAHKSQ